MAIPLFGMITGYYYDENSRSGRAVLQIAKIAKLLFGSIIFYIIWDVIVTLANGGSVLLYLRYYITPISLLKLFLLNAPMVGGHLWYLGALLYSLILLWVSDKLHFREKLYWLIPVLLLIHLAFGTYSVIFTGQRLPVLLTRNFLFFTLPFLLLGDWIRKTGVRMRNRSLLIIAVLSVGLILAEANYLLRSFSDFNKEFYLGTTALSFSVFLLVLQNGHTFHTMPFPLMAKLGKRTSTLIYILHYFIMGVTKSIAGKLSQVIPWVSAAYLWTRPLVVLAVCTAVAWLVTMPAFRFHIPVYRKR